jgi:hypothetical protein
VDVAVAQQASAVGGMLLQKINIVLKKMNMTWHNTASKPKNFGLAVDHAQADDQNESY